MKQPDRTFNLLRTKLKRFAIKEPDCGNEDHDDRQRDRPRKDVHFCQELHVGTVIELGLTNAWAGRRPAIAKYHV